MKYRLHIALMGIVLLGLVACSGGGSSTTTTTETPPTETVTLSYTTPANFATLVAQSYTPSTTLVATSSVTNRSRYMISNAATVGSSASYMTIERAYTDSTTAGYMLTAETVTSTSTYNSYLTKTIQLITASDGYYRLDSHLHPNHSIDVDATTDTLKFRNNFGKTAATANGYVTFAYDTSTRLLQAKIDTTTPMRHPLRPFLMQPLTIATLALQGRGNSST